MTASANSNGGALAHVMPSFNRNGHSAYQLLWSRDVLEVIR